MTGGAPKAKPVLVGRQRELDSLWNQFEQSMTGRLRVALVAGEPGIGKTRLLREVARRAEQAGAPVLRGGASEAEGMPPYQARLRLYEAVGMFLAAIAAPHGLLLLLDDLQWADTATLDLLCYVARSQPNARLLVLGAYREGEVTHRPAFERALTELNRLRQLTTITPGSLTETDLSTFAT